MTLTAEENEKLTRVGPGTPMGELLRRYWWPVAASAELVTAPTKAVRLLGEDLVLYKDRSGTLGLIDARCAHRRVELEWGIPEAHGLRCPYHGWLYDETGQCTEQPGEPTGSTFKQRIQMTAYPVQELGGLIFAYLGPAPVPLLPRYENYVVDNAIRDIGGTMLPCNWVQCMENSLDPIHTEWLHGHFTKYVLERLHGEPFTPRSRHAKIGFEIFEHGIYKRRVHEGGSEEMDGWRIGHPIIFPAILYHDWFQIRVPVDDTHTWHLQYNCVRTGYPVEPQDPVPYYELPYLDPQTGRPLVDMTNVGQDFWAWYSQGEIARRELEKLGVSDIGIIMYRELLLEQMEKVARGEDPMEVYRDPEKNVMITMPHEEERFEDTSRRDERERHQRGVGSQVNEFRMRFGLERFSPTARYIRTKKLEARERLARGETPLPGVVRQQPNYLPGTAREATIMPDAIKRT
jgi:5,5'-dehydrodivanillate O-demethylase